jgi:hypothetical protein
MQVVCGKKTKKSFRTAAFVPNLSLKTACGYAIMARISNEESFLA